MAERSNAAVLKTVDLRGSGGSNPSLSAEWIRGMCLHVLLLLFGFLLVAVMGQWIMSCFKWDFG